MGMFDWYQPRGLRACPVCGSPLREWQGKDGPCGLLVWEQGQAAPVEQRCDPEWQMDPEALSRVRLPERFVFYSHDCPAHIIEAEGRTCDEVWTEAVLLTVKGL